MKSILKYLSKKEWTMIVAVVVLTVAQVWLNLRLPEYMGGLTTVISTPGSQMGDVYWYGGRMVACAVGSLVMAIPIGLLSSLVGASFSQRIRSLQYNKVNSFSMNEINKFSIASLITRSTNDVTQVQLVVTIGLQLIIYAPMLAVWAVIRIAMNGNSMDWTIATGVAVLSLALIFSVLVMMVIPKFRRMQTLTDNINKVARDNLTGLPVIRAYNAEDYQETKFERANEDLTGTQLYTTHALAVMMPLVTIIISLLSVAIYWIAAILINNADPAEALPLISNMIVFSSYAMQVMMGFMMIMMLFIFLPRAQVAAKRINEVINTEPSIKDGAMNDSDNSLKGEVEFRNVGFKYPGAADYVLKDVSFSVKQGETIAFIGSTGSGKSTLINLLPRFYDATEGTVLLDGVDVREYKLESLYNKIGYIPQKSVLFTGTVASNVAFGDNGSEKATEDQIRNAVRIAQGADFVEKMDDAYDSEIAHGGTNLSGGQKQRLSIARAVCRAPEVYIFDDSFSALDYKTDRALRTALKKETRGITSMIVAQRIGTIMDADKIVVLDEGCVVGVGKHKELLRTCGVYKEIAMSQLSEEELAI